jgi:ABC-type transport system involved in multi-copper enzyme maturation permease subunit
MNRLVRAELLKWRTTRTLYGTIAGVVVLVALGVAAAIATAGTAGNAGLDTTEGVRGVFGGAVNAGFLLLVMGIITTAGEYRQNTITAALLVTPRRRQLVVAKTIAMAIVGAGIAVIATAVTLAVALPWLAAKSVHPALLSGDVAGVLLGSAAVMVLFGLIGVGIGAIVRNQVAAVVGSLAWLLVVEKLLVGLFPVIGKWLSFGASGSLIGSVDAGGELLPVGAAALLLLGYGAAFIAGGIRLTTTRDVVA